MEQSNGPAPEPVMTPRERVLTHLAGGPVDRLPLMPITMMLAARSIGATYEAYCHDHRVLVEAQIHTARTFGFDHVSCISDPTREASDLGASVQWFEDQPPAMVEDLSMLADKSRLATLRLPDTGTGRMGDRVEAAALFRQRLGGEFLIEGWVEGPCAETANLRGLSTLMLDFFDDPAFVHAAFEFTTDLALRFAAAQVEAGVDLVGVGDAAASLVGPKIYREFVAPHEQRLVDGIHAMGAHVRLHICGKTARIAGDMARLGADMVDVDSPVPLAAARAAAGPTQVLAGNLDPVAVVMRGTPAGIGESLAGCHLDAGPRWIVGAGCELPRDTPRENVEALATYAQAHRP